MTKQALDNVVNALEGKTELLMKKKILSLGKNYTVMDSSQTPLCYVRLDMGSNMMGNIASNYLGKWAGRMMQYTYSVEDTGNENALEIHKGKGAWKTNFEVTEPETGENLGVISLKRGLVGGMLAQWADQSSGQVAMVTQGNVMRRQYKITDTNNAEVASVRHKIAAVRDTWTLNVSPEHNLKAVIFATILDFEKEM